MLYALGGEQKRHPLRRRTPPRHTQILHLLFQKGKGHEDFLLHSDASSYKRSINKPGVGAGGAGSQGEDPALAAPRGIRRERRKRQAPVGLAAPGHGEAQQHQGLVQFRRFFSGEDVRVGAVVSLPEPCTKVLLLLLAESGSLVAFQQCSQLGRVFTVVLWELPSWLNPTPESPRRRRTSDGETGRRSSTRLLGLLVPSASCLVPPAAPHGPLQEEGTLPPSPGKASATRFRVNTQVPACPERVLGSTVGSCPSSG